MFKFELSEKDEKLHSEIKCKLFCSALKACLRPEYLIYTDSNEGKDHSS